MDSGSIGKGGNSTGKLLSSPEIAGEGIGIDCSVKFATKAG